MKHKSDGHDIAKDSRLYHQLFVISELRKEKQPVTSNHADKLVRHQPRLLANLETLLGQPSVRFTLAYDLAAKTRERSQGSHSLLSRVEVFAL